jgi:phosphatidylinositol glycan class Z
MPSLFHLHSKIANTSLGTRTNIIYWKTYMPPLHFLGISERGSYNYFYASSADVVIYSDVSSGMISFSDLAGAPQRDLVESLAASDYDRTFVVTPVAIWYTLPPPIKNCMEEDKLVFPHLDLDHISESFDAGAPDGLRLGVYTLSPDCVSV